MKRIFLCLGGLVLLTTCFALQFGRNVLSQNRNDDSYSVRVYNVDDLAVVYVNGNEVIRSGYRGTDQRYISNLLRPGKNEIRFVLRNNQEGYTYGFELYRGNEIVYAYECGLVDNSGCSKSTQTGVVFDRTVTIDYGGGSALNSVYNAVNYNARAISNRVVITNTMANAIRRAGIAANTAANAAYPSTSLTDIRKVDFKNFSYSGGCEPWDTSHPLRNGHTKYGESDYDVADLKAVKYVDFDGDKQVEAFVTVEWTTSGSAGGGMNAYVYAIRNRSLEMIWSKCNERSDFLLSGKTIRYNYPEYVGDDAHCCPTYGTTDTYAWKNGGIVRVSKVRKRTGNK